MSGIVGIVHGDGRPIDRALLRRLTQSLKGRGPDAQEIWIDAHVGFGHALLRTTDDQAAERQPLSLDGVAWMVADARVDGRGELLSALQSAGEAPAATACD